MRKRSEKSSQSGIALFMVISAVALLSILVAELTYSTQMNSRLAYNYVDGLKAYYLAKAGFKLSLVRLRAYMQVKNFTNDPNNKQVKDAMPKGLVEKIWNMPFIFPLPIPKEASMGETDAIKEFMKESKLSGSYTAIMTSESTKLNLNNLFVKQITPEAAGATGSTGAAPGSAPATDPTQQTQTAAANNGASPTPVDFRQALEPAITTAIELKKNEDRDFATVYRNVNGKDVVDAIFDYLFENQPPSNLPGFRPIKPKLAPFYSLSELHLIPGIDDTLYNLLEPLLTVYSTPGINVNTMNKKTLLALIPEMTDQEAEDLLRRRDDPEVGQPWNSEQEFWDAIGGTSAGKSLQTIKDRWAKANLKPIFSEQAFKIGVAATVGLATRRLEAYVSIDPKAAKSTPSANSGQAGTPGTPAPANGPTGATGVGQNPQDPASAKNTNGINLVYWRML